MQTIAAHRQDRSPTPTPSTGSRGGTRELAWRSGERPTHSRRPAIFQETGSGFPDACADLRVHPV